MSLSESKIFSLKRFITVVIKLIALPNWDSLAKLRATYREVIHTIILKDFKNPSTRFCQAVLLPFSGCCSAAALLLPVVLPVLLPAAACGSLLNRMLLPAFVGVEMAAGLPD